MYLPCPKCTGFCKDIEVEQEGATKLKCQECKWTSPEFDDYTVMVDFFTEMAGNQQIE